MAMCVLYVDKNQKRARAVGAHSRCEIRHASGVMSAAGLAHMFRCDFVVVNLAESEINCGGLSLSYLTSILDRQKTPYVVLPQRKTNATPRSEAVTATEDEVLSVIQYAPELA